MTASENLHPIFDRVVTREEKEASRGQRARVLWFYGLSGSGKSTLAVALERRLAAEGRVTHLLDGDNLRTGLNRGLGFSDEDRAENLRRVAEVAKLFLQAGVVTICSFITPLRAHRALVRGIIGADDLIEVYVDASYATCLRRDPKGLYAKAASGAVAHFTGRDSAFEPPLPSDPGEIISTEREAPEASLARLHAWVGPRLQLPTPPVS